MKKNKFNYSDFSKKEIEDLKEYYVTEKVKSMNESELKRYVYDSVSHQVKNTIGEEEEQEAWDEIQNFFSDNFDMILEKIKKKFEAVNKDPYIESKKLTNVQSKETDEFKNERKDMWMD